MVAMGFLGQQVESQVLVFDQEQCQLKLMERMTNVLVIYVLWQSKLKVKAA